MRSPTRMLAAALLAVVIAACSDQTDPVAPSRRLAPNATRAAMTVSSSSPDLALLMIDVTGGDLETPLRYDIVLTKGLSESPLTLPEGKGYQLAIRGFDGAGNQTHQGSAAVPSVRVGENPTLGAALKPVVDGVKSVKLEASVLGEPRLEKGSKLVVEMNQEEILKGAPIHLNAYVLNARGERIDVDPSGFHWFMDDPRIDLFDPARPHGPQDDIKWRPDFTFPPDWRLGLVVGQFEVVVVVLFPITAAYVDVSAGQSVTCALRAFGSIDCWGDNQAGMLGDGLSGQSSPTLCSSPAAANGFFRCTPKPVAGSKAFSAVSVGGDHVCAIERMTGAAFCWGSNGSGQLGFAGAANQPMTPVAGMHAFRSISAGATHSCGVTTTNEAFCWGNNFNRQLGTTGAPSAGTLVQLSNPNGYKSVTAGDQFTCTVDQQNMVECIGDRANKPHITTSVASLGQGTTASHACAVKSIRDVWCWGWNAQAQLGDGTFGMNISNEATRVMVSGNTFRADQVTTGFYHSCALVGTDAFCWGGNYNGELGIGGFGSKFEPVKVVPASGTTLSFTKITAGGRHTCGLVTGGGIFCWGANESGQLGIGQQHPAMGTGVATPMRVIGS